MPNYAAVAHPSLPFVTIYDTADWSKVPDPASLPSSQGNAVAFSPSATWLAVGSDGSPYLAVYDTSDWSKLPGPVSQPNWSVYALAFSPDNSRLVVGGRGAISIAVYDTSDWSQLPSPAFMPDADVYGVAFSPSGALLAAVGYSTYVTIYNADDFSVRAVPAWPAASDAYATAFSPDGSVLAVAGVGFSSGQGRPLLVLYNTADWSVIATPSLVERYAHASSVAFSPDGAHIAVSLNAGAVESFVVLSTVDWSLTHADTGTGNAASIAYSTDGGVLAVGFESADYLRLYNTGDWAQLPNPLVQPANAARGIAFVPAAPPPPEVAPFWTQLKQAAEV